VILWTANAQGSDNTSGRLPFNCPDEKSTSSSQQFSETNAVAPLLYWQLVLSIGLRFIPGAAQSRNQKRIMSIQIGEVSEGSRVTVVSDSALNDYEAFRRGDRFYVRIPLAEFTAGQPHFRGDGFEDVQVQKVGDSIVVSFKLQPGATARVINAQIG